MEKLCIVRCGPILCGISTNSLCEALGSCPITPVPLAPHHVLGIMVHRGDVLGVVDLPAALGQPRCTGATVLVVQPHASMECFALIVDALEDMVPLSETSPAPDGSGLALSIGQPGIRPILHETWGTILELQLETLATGLWTAANHYTQSSTSQEKTPCVP